MLLASPQWLHENSACSISACLTWMCFCWFLLTGLFQQAVLSKSGDRVRHVLRCACFGPVPARFDSNHSAAADDTPRVLALPKPHCSTGSEAKSMHICTFLQFPWSLRGVDIIDVARKVGLAPASELQGGPRTVIAGPQQRCRAACRPSMRLSLCCSCSCRGCHQRNQPACTCGFAVICQALNSSDLQVLSPCLEEF